jgi:hypothetical protein
VPVYPPVRVVEETVYGLDDNDYDNTIQHATSATIANTAVGLAAWNPQRGVLVHVNSDNEVCYSCLPLCHMLLQGCCACVNMPACCLPLVVLLSVLAVLAAHFHEVQSAHYLALQKLCLQATNAPICSSFVNVICSPYS